MSAAAENDPDALDALPSGALIGGYTIRGVLGHGGFGITYKADNTVTGRSVAIKEFFPASLVRRSGNASKLIYSKVNEETINWALRKFEETTTTLCRLNHPNIVQVLNYVQANDTGYMIMELLKGQTLKDWVKSRERAPTLNDLRPMLDPVMSALTYVHGLSLIHRDIAPDNILITDDRGPVLIDFGSVSRDLSDVRHQAFSGTVGLTKRHYTAPEQMQAKARPNPEADIYSMGAVLYWALTGDEPADGRDRQDKLFQGEADPYESLMTKRPITCPIQAARAIDNALAVRPQNRLHSIAALQAALVFQQPRQVEGPIPKKWLATMTALLALTALAGVLAGAWIVRNDHRPAEDDMPAQRQQIEAARNDLAKQHGEFETAKVALDRRSAEIAIAENDVVKQSNDLKRAQSDLDRRNSEIEAATAALAKQRDELDAVKVALDRRSAEVAIAENDVAKQSNDLRRAQSDLDRRSSEVEAATTALAKQRVDLGLASRRDDIPEISRSPRSRDEPDASPPPWCASGRHKKPTEEVICSSSQLWRLESDRYTAFKGRIDNLHGFQHVAAKRDEAKWISERDQRCGELSSNAIEACLLKLEQEHIELLRR